MKILSYIFVGTGLLIWFVTKQQFISQQQSQALFPDLLPWLIEKQTVIGFELWIPFIFVGFSILIQTHRKQRQNKSTTQPNIPVPMFPEKATVGTAEKIYLENWREELVAKSNRLTLPMSTSIEIDPLNGVPLGLKLNRSTPGTSRRAIEEFAYFISTIPTPPRIYIFCIEIEDPGMPFKNLVKSALQKYINTTTLTITTQPDGVNITFSKPDECWKSNPNLQA